MEDRGAGAGPLILVIDDDKEVLTTCAFALRHEGYRVLEASSGEEGLEVARQERPALILSDINMPGLDGRGVLRRMRESGDLADCQIVLMTGNGSHVTPRLGMELGADDFLVKPFSLEALRRCVGTRLARANERGRIRDRLLGELKATISGTLPHEFFTPLTGVLGMAQLLREGWDEISDRERDEMLREIEQCGWRLHRTLRNYLELLPLHEQAPLEREAIEGAEMDELIATTSLSVAHRHGREADLSLRLMGGKAMANREAVSKVVEELVENAFGFSDPGSPVEVVWSEAGKLEVLDRGRGIAADQLEDIGAFAQFERDRYEQQGLGLGLQLTARLVAALGAKFAIESEVGAGTRVTVQLQTP